jgi:hypothetical protein
MERLIAPILLIGIVLFPLVASADAQVHEWIGQYNMDHDGWVGTLSILDSKQDCATSPWCHLALRYTDAQGHTLTGGITTIDQQFQHMVFTINFPNNTQTFDAYLFSWDKTKMAGTTYWGGRTFGFFAMKR